MTLQLANQINRLPECAPLGYEEQYLRRLFLDNFFRCCRVREFQKIVKWVLIDKLHAPTSTLIFNHFEEKALARPALFQRITERLTYLPSLRKYRKNQKYFITNLNVYNKKNEIVSRRIKRAEEWHQFYYLTIYNYLQIFHEDRPNNSLQKMKPYAEKLLTVGYYRFMESRNLKKKIPDWSNLVEVREIVDAL